MPPEDLSREIERLWARLGPGADVPPAFTPPAGAIAGAEVAWETVGLLKRQQREREATWGQAFDAKEQALKVFLERCAALEAEVSELRGRVDGGEERMLADLLDARARLEGAAKALDEQRKRHDEERAALQSALEQARARAEEEAARLRDSERKREAREAQHLLDLREFQSLADRRGAEASQAVDSAAALKAGLSEAKNALEKTLAELLLERRARQDSDEERARALKRVEELQGRFGELEKVWEEERAQWRELWDRERSTWETQRQELAQWEERLRREREAWHAELRTKESAHTRFTDDLTQRLRDTTLAAQQVDQRMRGLEARAESDRRASGAAAGRRESLLVFARGAAAAAFAAAVLLAGWSWSRAWRWTSESMAPVAASNPSAMAYDGNLLWIADWSGGLGAVDPADPRRAAASFLPPAGGPYRPTAVAFGAGVMWTLDAAQARVLRHPAGRPDKVLASRPSPGPAPTALAFDGASLWSYDAANRSFYRHGDDEGSTKSFPLEGDAVPNAMAWRAGRLWVHDSKSGRLLVLAPREGRLAPVDSAPAPAPGLLGLAFATPVGRSASVFVLAGASAERSSPSLMKLRLSRRAPLTVF
jgi:hypothetical protein